MSDVDQYDDGEGQEAPPAPEASSEDPDKRSMRNIIKGLERENRELRTANARREFSDAGLNPSLADWYLTEKNPPPIAEWAEAKGFTPQGVQPAVPATAAASSVLSGRFDPTGTGTPPGPSRWTYEQYREAVTDPARHQEAMEHMAAGLVDE